MQILNIKNRNIIFLTVMQKTMKMCNLMHTVHRHTVNNPCCAESWSAQMSLYFLFQNHALHHTLSLCTNTLRSYSDQLSQNLLWEDFTSNIDIAFNLSFVFHVKRFVILYLWQINFTYLLTYSIVTLASSV